MRNLLAFSELGYQSLISETLIDIRDWASQVALVIRLAVKESYEMWVSPLIREDPLEEGMATHSSLPARRIPWREGAWQAAVHGVTLSWTWLKRLKMHAYDWRS